MAGVGTDGNGPMTDGGAPLDRHAHGQDGMGITPTQLEGRKRTPTLIEGQVCRAGFQEIGRQPAQHW